MVSVVIPAYNVEKYIKKCIESVIEQTHKDIEIIVVDDGSTDSTGKICHELKERYRNIKYIYQENKGVSEARNTGIRESKGDYLMFVDGDDYIDPEITERLMEKIHEGYDIVCCCCKTAGEETVFEDHFFKGDRIFSKDGEKEDLYLQLIDPRYGKCNERTITAIGGPVAKIYKSDIIKSERLQFDPELKRLQDNLFNMYAFAAADSIYYLDQALYNYVTEHIVNYYKDYRHPHNSELLIEKRKRFFEQNERFYTEKVKEKFEIDIYRSLLAGLKYYASRSRMYDRNVRKAFIKMINKKIYSGSINISFPGKLKHEVIIDLLISMKMYLILFCLLRLIL